MISLFKGPQLLLFPNLNLIHEDTSFEQLKRVKVSNVVIALHCLLVIECENYELNKLTAKTQLSILHPSPIGDRELTRQTVPAWLHRRRAG